MYSCAQRSMPVIGGPWEGSNIPVLTCTVVLLTYGFFLPSQELGQLLPAAKRIECKKHIVSVDCPKHCPKSEQADMNRIMWDILGSETTELRDGGIEQLKIHCPSFYSQYFVPELLPKLKNICFCDNKHFFTNGTAANSYTESMNSSMERWFVSASDFHCGFAKPVSAKRRTECEGRGASSWSD